MNRKIDIDFTDPNHIFLTSSYEEHSINQELIDNEATKNPNISKHVHKNKIKIVWFDKIYTDPNFR